jgi:hypothetical protein
MNHASPMESFPYATARAFEAALTARFKRLALETPFNPSQLRRQFAYDRLLARCFTASDEQQWILKGGISMLARLRQARHSADVDLVAAADSIETALTALTKTAARDLGDFFHFTLGNPTRVVQGIEGIRVPVKAHLGPRPYESFHIDLVTAVTITGTIETAHPVVPLDIPGLIRPDYRLYPLADTAADKICAITERPQGTPSTRFRDLVDLVLIARTRQLDATELRIALTSEHHRRALPPRTAFDVPDHTLWEAGYTKVAARAPGIDGHRDLASALNLTKGLIDPILAGIRTYGTWNPTTSAWTVDT